MNMDDLSKNLDKFYENIGHVGNVYHLYSINKDGEITQEAFGKNVVTDYGLLNRWFHDYAGSYPNRDSYLNLYIGNSTQLPTFEDKKMFSLLISSAAGKTNNSDWGIRRTPYRYGIKYIKPENDKQGVFTQRFKLNEYYFDYNLSGVTNNLVITEIGLGADSNNLFSHSLIYDINGDPTNIVKKPNEKLFIHTYSQGAVPVGLIEDLNRQGKACYLKPYIFAGPVETDPYFTIIPLARGVNVIRNSGNIGDRFDSADNLITVGDRVVQTKNAITSMNRLFENKYHYVSASLFVDSLNYSYNTDGSNARDYWNCGYGYNPADHIFCIHQFEYLPNNETEYIDAYDIYTNTYDSNSFTNTFGIECLERRGWASSEPDYRIDPQGRIPAVQFDIESVTMYNHLTKQWDIEEAFECNPNYNYDLSLFSWQFETNIDINGSTTRFNTTCNPFFNDPTRKIKSFNNSGITLYATDSYWDYDSYELIPNLSSVPENLRNKKYYITKGGAYVRLQPEYGVEEHTMHHLTYEKKIIDVANIVTTSFEGNSAWTSSKMLSSDKCGWILLSRTLIYPDAEGGPKGYTISFAKDNTSANAYSRYCRFATDDRIILFNSAFVKNSLVRYNDVRIYNVEDPYNPPTYIDLRLPFTRQPSTTSDDDSAAIHPIVSISDDGIVCVQQYGYNEACLVDLYNWENPTYMISNSRLAHVNNISNYVVYQRADIKNYSKFEIIDGKTHELIDEFELPDTNTYVINGIRGWKHYVYIAASYGGKDDIIRYNIDDHSISFRGEQWGLFRNNMYNASIYTTEYSNDECYIITTASTSSSFGASDGQRSSMMIITADDPMTPKHFYNSDQNIAYRGPRAPGILKYANDGKSLVFVSKGVSDDNNARAIGQRLCVFDIGRFIDTNEQITWLPGNAMPNTSNAEWGCYKDWIYYYNRNTAITSYPNQLVFFPIAQFMAHNIKGTTRNITGFNNPFRIQGKTAWVKMTNDMDKLYHYDPSYNEKS